MNNTLYLVTDTNLIGKKDFFETLRLALEGGVDMVQLREKNLCSKSFYEKALKTKALCKEFKVPFLINDRLDIAQAVDADGVHLGQSDLPLNIARKLLGKKIIGISCQNLDLALKAEQEGADYIGCGAVFGTKTKKDTQNLGLSGLKTIRQAVNLPIVAIGGIKHSNITQVKACGVESYAVVSAILAQENVKKATQELKQLL